MESLAPAYLAAIATQVGALSAFLGGFAATFLGTLLALGGRGRTASLAIACAVSASVAFVVAVVASVALVTLLHPLAPPTVAAASPKGAQLVMAATFVFGLYAVLLSLALSGWSRSRRTGWTTSIVAGLGIVLVSGLVIGIR